MATYHRPPPINNKKETAIFYCFFLAIFSLSFYLYSPYTSIRFSSDHAVHVLMAYDFKFPDNLYFWGQDRLGSFVPMLAHFISSAFSVSPLFSVTLVHWGLLFFTALMICRFFSTLLLKILFLIFWLIPLYPFKEHLALAHPYAPQFFFIFLGMLLIERFDLVTGKKRYLWLAAGGVTMFMSCWISELSAPFIALFFLLRSIWRMTHTEKPKILFRKTDVVAVLLLLCVAALGGSFISYAKANAAEVPQYTNLLSEPGNWIAGIQKHYADLVAISTHADQHLLKFCYLLLLFSLLPITLISLWKERSKLPKENHFYLWLFWASAIFFWFGLYFLSWTHINDYDYRHWTFPYLFVVLAFLLSADMIPIKLSIAKVALIVLAATQIPISYSYATDKTRMRNDIDFCYSEFSGFRRLGKSGLIGNYWFSYVVAAADPSRIVATPGETDYARGKHLIPLVFQQPKIYLAKNRWFDKWPSFSSQYGHILRKKGSPFSIERVEFCEYRLSDNGFFLGSVDLMHDSLSSEVGGGILVHPGNAQTEGFAVFGPFMELPSGSYTGHFELDSLRTFAGDMIALDIVSDRGELVLFSKTFSYDEIKENALLNVPFEFSLPYTIRNIETRIYVKGKPSFRLRGVDFTKK